MESPEEFIAVRRPQSYTPRTAYWPAYTWPIQTSYLKVIPAKRSKIFNDFVNKDEGSLRVKISTLFDKLNSTFYHLQRLKEVEAAAIAQANELAKVGMPGMENLPGVVGMPYEPISYEYEALLAGAKTTLDMLAITIAHCLNRKEDEIISLLNNLGQAKKPSKQAARIRAVLKRQKNQRFINEFKNPDGQKSKRNYAVHVGSLPIGTINVPINNPVATTLRSKAYEPHVSIQEQISKSRATPDLQDYAEEVFYSTCDVVVETLRVLLRTRFTTGSRCSLQEEGRAARKEQQAS